MTRRHTALLGAFLILGFLGYGCGASSPAVATLGDEKITVRDFENSYAKNNGGWDAGVKATEEERQRFLDLLVKFRLKVKEAKSRGLLQDSAIQSELKGYELSVAQSYMVEKEIVEPNLKKLYERKKEEIRASHILIRAAENASPEDTLKAYEKAMMVMGRMATKSFDSLAVIYSEDQSASFNKGDLGYFSTGRMVAPFEDAAYAMQPGQWTQKPIRTQFGYHIIKVTDRRAARGAIRISFIFLGFKNPKDSTAVRDSAWTYYRQLKAGADFSLMASQHSQEGNSASRGGDVGFYDRERLPPDIGELLYRTPKDSLTEPFLAPNGVYIFKVTGMLDVPSYKDMEKDLKQVYQQLRYPKDHENYVRNLRTIYRVALVQPTVEDLAVAFDTTKTPADSLWNELTDEQLNDHTLLMYSGKNMAVREALERVSTMVEVRTFLLTPANVKDIVNRLVEAVALEEHARKAGERHPAFADLMGEYRDGILLYRIEQDEVWQQVTVNDSVLKVFYEAKKQQFRWPDRVNFAEIFVNTDSLKDVVVKRLRRGEDFLTVAEDMTMRAGYRDKKGVWGFQSYTFNDLSIRASNMKVDSVSDPFKVGAYWSIVTTLEKDSARVKTFEEAGLEVTSAYQEQAAKDRELEWVASLKAKYGVTIDVEALRSAFTRARVLSE